MAKSSSHNSSSPEITPKKEHVTLDQPESLNPFLLADQVEFTFKEIALTTNNKVALLYPSYPKSDYFEVVSDFISKCRLKKAFTRTPSQYKEYLCEFWYLSFGRHLEELLELIWRRNGQDYGPTPTVIKNFSTVAGDSVTDTT
ncbi:hypothetical protein Tco_0723915 [Tanacetum coccineum]